MKPDAGFPTPWEKVGERFRFRPGEVTILAGENFSGKSEVCGQITVDLMAQGERACVASMEFNPEGWIARIMQQVATIPSGTATEHFAHKVVDWLQVVEKQRNGGDTPKALLWFDRRSHQFLESRKTRPTQYIEWTGSTAETCPPGAAQN